MKSTIDTPVKSLPDDATCLECGYSLRGLSQQRCPECGKSFDINDAISYRTSSRPWYIDLAHSPRWWHVLLLIVIATILLEAYSRPLGLVSLLYSMSVFSLLIPPLVVWLATSYFIRLVACRRFPSQKKSVAGSNSRRQRMAWKVSTLCVFSIFSPLVFNWPLYLRFRISLPSFEQTITQRATAVKGRWIGLYYVIEDVCDGYRVYYTDHDKIGSGPGWGFAHCKNPTSNTSAGIRPRFHHHLIDDWYVWSRW